MRSMLGMIVVVTMIACNTTKPTMTVDHESVTAGGEVVAGGKAVSLYESRVPVSVGSSLVTLVKEIGGDQMIAGKVAIINVVPSIDTPVCEEQSHILGETTKLAANVVRVSISRDLPMAAARFAKEANLQNIVYLSDYKDGSFGKKSGLMMKGNELLARAVIVVDEQGIIRHVQIVPDVSHLPDMEKAIAVANQLTSQL